MSERRSLLVLVDGVPTVVTYRGGTRLLEIITRALDQTGNTGQRVEDWELRTAYELSPQDLNLHLDQLDLPAHAQLFLSPREAVYPRAGTARRNRAETGILWDESGLEWTTKHIRWATVQQVKAFLHRDGPVGFVDDQDCISWLDPAAARKFWAEAEGYFEVPGVSGSRLTQPGLAGAPRRAMGEGASGSPRGDAPNRPDGRMEPCRCPQLLRYRADAKSPFLRLRVSSTDVRTFC